MKSVILGGTGTLGREMARQLLKDPKNTITVFSRDELKQKEMQKEFGNSPALRFRLGDIRDRVALDRIIAGSDTVFHFAALKHIDVLEANPEESIKTNILGTLNVADACQAAGVKYCIFSSTDKAVDPINVYGMCKGISERILLARNRAQSATRFRVYRWGNVVGSRGSAIHGFAEAIRNGKPVPLTDPKMTRFWIRIEDAVQFILTTYKDSIYSDDVAIPDMRAARVVDVIASIARGVRQRNVNTIPIGLRAGEKIHESLRSIHDHRYAPVSSDSCRELSPSELDDMIHPLLPEAIVFDINAACVAALR